MQHKFRIIYQQWVTPTLLPTGYKFYEATNYLKFNRLKICTNDVVNSILELSGSKSYMTIEFSMSWRAYRELLRHCLFYLHFFLHQKVIVLLPSWPKTPASALLILYHKIVNYGSCRLSLQSKCTVQDKLCTLNSVILRCIRETASVNITSHNMTW